jgi:hypothetical protein
MKARRSGRAWSVLGVAQEDARRIRSKILRTSHSRDSDEDHRASKNSSCTIPNRPFRLCRRLAATAISY